MMENCRHKGGEDDCPPACLYIHGERFVTEVHPTLFGDAHVTPVKSDEDVDPDEWKGRVFDCRPPGCTCIGHRFPGVSHIVPCCEEPHL